MRGILAAHQLPPTQHLCQSMNIEWPPPPAFGVRWGSEAGREAADVHISYWYFLPFFFLRAPEDSVSTVAKSFWASITVFQLSISTQRRCFCFSLFLFFLQTAFRLSEHVLFFIMKRLQRTVFPLLFTLHLFVCFLFCVFFSLRFDIHHLFAQQAWSKKKLLFFAKTNKWAHCNYMFHTHAHTPTRHQ